jgi:hypothetical protein
MGQYSTNNNAYFEEVKAFCGDKYSISVSTAPPYSIKAHFTICSNAFRAQEWSNLSRDDVWRLPKSPPLVSLLVAFVAPTSNNML